MSKKTYILSVLIILLLFILIALSIITIPKLKERYLLSKCEQNIYNFDGTSPFSINKIVYFSSSNAEATINANSSFTISNLYQYTDIAIFINNHTDGNYTPENTLKNVVLSDIKIHSAPSVGTPNIYFKNLNDFAKNHYDKTKKIDTTLEFATSAENELDYSSPILFNNCANPITLCYVNSNLKSNYTLNDNISNISYNGSLLKHCNITLNSIACKLSFLITITNNQDEIYTCPVILNIPLSTENSTLYDGNLILNDATNYNFIKSQQF